MCEVPEWNGIEGRAKMLCCYVDCKVRIRLLMKSRYEFGVSIIHRIYWTFISLPHTSTRYTLYMYIRLGVYAENWFTWHFSINRVRVSRTISFSWFSSVFFPSLFFFNLNLPIRSFASTYKINAWLHLRIHL